MPGSKASEIVVELHIHVCDHPLEALTIAVVPGAETSSLLWPQVNHFSGEVSWVSNNRSCSMGNSHKAKFTPIVADVVVDPPKEELVLEENVKVSEGGPIKELIACKREPSSKKVRRSFFKWNSQQSLSW